MAKTLPQRRQVACLADVFLAHSREQYLCSPFRRTKQMPHPWQSAGRFPLALGQRHSAEQNLGWLPKLCSNVTPQRVQLEEDFFARQAASLLAFAQSLHTLLGGPLTLRRPRSPAQSSHLFGRGTSGRRARWQQEAEQYLRGLSPNGGGTKPPQTGHDSTSLSSATDDPSATPKDYTPTQHESTSLFSQTVSGAVN